MGPRMFIRGIVAVRVSRLAYGFNGAAAVEPRNHATRLASDVEASMGPRMLIRGIEYGCLRYGERLQWGRGC